MFKGALLFLIILILGLGFYFLYFQEEATTPKLSEQVILEQGQKTTEKIEDIPGRIEETTEIMKIVTVYDNYQANDQLKTGWGFACLIKISEKSILFDTGADSETLFYNMEKMKMDPKEIDIVALSHIHGDHIGGLEGFLEKNGEVTVYIPVSFPNPMRDKIKSYGGEYVDVSVPAKILERVSSTGELGNWLKEQSLIIDSEKGLIIITGCAHPGIVNIIKKAKEIYSQEDVYLVLGGFHLRGVSDQELQEIINDFRKLNVQKVAPCHCSGERCRELFKAEYQNDFIENGVGKIIEIYE